MNDTAQPRKSKSGLIILIILIALFALPEIIAVGLQVMKWRPETTTNRGKLVQPPRPINSAALQTLDNKTLKFTELQRKWTAVYIADAECDAICAKNLFTMRQVQKALGKEQERMQRVFIPVGEISNEKLKEKLKDYPGMVVITGPKQEIAALTQQFVLPDAKAVDQQLVYLVDPLGNLMMTYRDDPPGMLKDLRHLMKTSWAG